MTINAPPEPTTVARHLELTLSPESAVRREAEKSLNAEESNPEFIVTLFHIVSSVQAPSAVRHASSVLLKNVVRRRWEDVPADHKQMIKDIIVQVMMSTPVPLRRQLSEVLSIVASHEYPQNWPTLLPQLALKLVESSSSSPPNWESAQGVLETLHALFERYKFQYRSDPLFLEIKYSLDNIHEPLLSSFTAYTTYLFSAAPSSPLVLEVIELCCKIYYSLVWQDLPEVIENNLDSWNGEFYKLLKFASQDPRIEGDAEDTDPSPLDKVQAAVIEATELFVSKYDEEIGKYLDNFVTDVWSLLVKRGSAQKYDGVATTGIRFLTTVAKSPYYSKFAGDETLQQICQNIVVPNVQLRDEDVELFEDNPVEYIRRDIEGSDTGTRRKAACELVNGLCSHYEQQVTKALSSYVNSLLAQYASDPQSNWKAKDAAIYLVTALGWRSGTLTGGATTTSQLVDVVEFFQTNVITELRAGASNPQAVATPILVADAIKYATTFRNQLPTSLFAEVFSLTASLLSCPIEVVHSYSALCIERLLTVKDVGPNGKKVARYDVSCIRGSLQPLLHSVQALLANSKTENEWAMKMLLRVVTVAGREMRPHLEFVLQGFNQILERVTRNPANPLFNHYLFETVASLLRFLCNTEASPIFETALFPSFEYILANDVSEFAPYVFQIFAQMIKAKTAGQVLAQSYAVLLVELLKKDLWDRPGYVPGMVQYIEALMRQSPEHFSEQQMMDGLGIVQKLVSSKLTDHHGMSLLTCIVETYGTSRVGPELSKKMLQVVITRQFHAPTAKYGQALLCFLSVMIVKVGPEIVVQGMEGIHAGLFQEFMTGVWLKQAVSISAKSDRKTCAVGMATLVGSRALEPDGYSGLWVSLLNCTIAVLEGIQVEHVHHEHEESCGAEGCHGHDAEYNVAYSQLAWGHSHAVGPFRGVEPRGYLATQLDEVSKRGAVGKYPTLVRQLEGGAQQVLTGYLAAAGKTVH